MSGEAGYYRRPLPEGLISFASAEGRRLFREALAEGNLEGWFALAEQFHTQADPAFCGLGTLVVALNALGVDPGRVWKGPWRWYSEELLDCCLPLDAVRSQGITLDHFACLARCNGVSAVPVRASTSTLDAFRAELRAACTTADGPVLAVSYTRRALGQTGDGHFSPVAGYHAGRDLALVLDVARFKYPPHWVPVPMLWDAMLPPDPATGRSRGWVSLRRRGPGAAAVFRLSDASLPWAEVARRLHVELPVALATAAPASAAAVVAAFVAWMRATAPGLVTPHDSPEADALLTALRATPIAAAVRDAAGPDDAARAEVAAMLLLALPAETFEGLDPRARDELRALRGLDALPAGLRVEVDLLREQVTALGEAGSAVFAGGPRCSPGEAARPV